MDFKKLLGKWAGTEGRLKIIIFLLVIFLVISVFIVFNLQSSKSALLREYSYTKQNLTQENEKLLSKLNSLLAENKGLEDRLGIAQVDLERIVSEKEQLQRSYEFLNSEMEELMETSKKYVKLKDKYEILNEENKTSKELVDSLEKDKNKLESELKELENINDNLKQKIEEARQVIRGKENFVKYEDERSEISGVGASIRSVDLPPIVVSPKPHSDNVLFSSLKGKVINVNKRYNFVVVDLGRQMGVKEGMVFSVFRGNRPIGKIEVIRLRDKIAACDIIQADTIFNIDDIVRY